MINDDNPHRVYDAYGRWILQNNGSSTIGVGYAEDGEIDYVIVRSMGPDGSIITMECTL